MKTQRTVTLKILGRELQVNCPEGQEHELMDAAHYLDQTMHSIRKQGRVIGLERIAMMAALNITHELLQVRSQREDYINTVNHGLQRLTEKLTHCLTSEEENDINKPHPEMTMDEAALDFEIEDIEEIC